MIVIDGIDGCGKSTQAKLLEMHLRKHLDVTVHKFRDPGTTPAGELIRDLLLHKKEIQLCPATQTALFLAARAQVWHDLIRPALDRGEVVVSDRWVASTIAYQVYGESMGKAFTSRTPEDVAGHVWRMSNMLSGCPNLTLILDFDPEVAMTRTEANDRYESKGLPYVQRLRHGYLEFTGIEEASSIVMVDKEETPAVLFERIRQRLAESMFIPRSVQAALRQPFSEGS